MDWYIYINVSGEDETEAVNGVVLNRLLVDLDGDVYGLGPGRYSVNFTIEAETAEAASAQATSRFIESRNNLALPAWPITTFYVCTLDDLILDLERQAIP